MKYCVKCGNTLADDDVFCAKCGSKQTAASESSKTNITNHTDNDYLKKIEQNTNQTADLASAVKVLLVIGAAIAGALIVSALY